MADNEKILNYIANQLGNGDRFLLEINGTRAGIQQLIELLSKALTHMEVVQTSPQLVTVVRCVDTVTAATAPIIGKLN